MRERGNWVQLGRLVRFLVCALGAGWIMWSARPAAADLPLRELNQRLPQVHRALLRQRDPRHGVLARTQSLSREDVGVELPAGFSVVRADRVSAGAETFFSAPKRLLLDHVAEGVGMPAFLQAVSGTGSPGKGRGVVIGVADSGVDLTHADLRDAEGKSRVAWLIDFATEPLGFYPELEASFGCSSELRCAVLGQPEIDALIAAGALGAPSGVTAQLPRDVLGHGTHVATIAAGGGLADSRYTGIAPEATLVVAQLASPDASVEDGAVALAAQFVYDRADALGMPAVLNLSLGGDFGPHDGKSVLGDVLEGFLDRPGRGMVVAAGNSGGLITGAAPEELEPLGIHTTVQVASGRSVLVPLVLPASGTDDGSVYIWIGSQSGDSLAIAIEDEDGNELLAPVIEGDAASNEVGPLTVTVVNQVTDFASVFEDIERGAVALLQGAFDPGSRFFLRLSGSASVGLWVQSEGGLSPNAGSIGALFSNARREGTIATPADTPRLIAVGATLNRVDWPGRSGRTVQLEQFDPELNLELGSSAFFSGLGPTARGDLKPDILAPGGVVVAGLSKSADPNLNTGLSLFARSPLCSGSVDCAVVDNEHATSIGTSMASPIVAGAVALLLEQNSALTQDELRHLVQASARRLDDATSLLSQGIGNLNVPRALDALTRMSGDSSEPEVPAALSSWLTLSDNAASIGSAGRLQGILHLRTTDDAIADPPTSALSLELKNGTLLDELKRVAPGVYSFDVKAKSDSKATLEVAVLYRGEALTKTEVAVLRAPRPTTPVASDSSCSLHKAGAARAGHFGWVLFGLVWGLFWRRRARAHFDARCVRLR